MKLIAKRALVLLLLALLLLWGLYSFTAKYLNNAARWVQHPSNRHLYADGTLRASGTIYDCLGNILLQVEEGSVKFNEDRTVRTAVMHAVGDLHGNVATGAQAVFGERLSGWGIINGVYTFHNKRSFLHDLNLTLDARLCAAAYRELKGYRGTIGVYNYKTGEICCMVSTPSFDPENPPNPDSDAEKYEGVYLNRLLSATYTPGSVFKLVTAAAALENLSEENLYHCSGKLQIGDELVTCLSAHGEVTLEQALAHSCNVAFARITLELGADTLQKYAELAGFNAGLAADGIKTAVGKVDLQGAEGADLAWAGVGQYTNTANPLNFMAFMGAIANDGLRVTPKLLAGRGPLSFLLVPPLETKRVLAAETAQKLGKMMRNNTLSVYGEGKFQNLELCAKSGTAEVGGGEKPHAWFAGFLKREDFPLAFVVVVENGGSGSGIAAGIAAKVLQEATK